MNLKQVQQVVVHKGDLVAHDEGLATLVLGQQGLERQADSLPLRYLGSLYVCYIS